MYQIVGLGNVGAEYANTRHNIGWIMLDALRIKHHMPEPILKTSVSGLVTEGKISGVSVSALYPCTMMNNSGAAVRKFVSPKDISKLVVLYDDIDVPLGKVRVSFGRGDGGHNGIKSIVEKMGSRDFVRVRIGIGKVGFWPWERGTLKRPQGASLPRYVLGTFSKHELTSVEKVSEAVDEIVTVIVQYGHITAMNKFN